MVGPLKLDQSAWQDSAERLEMACQHALHSEHRVAVLADTPTPDRLREDLDLMVKATGQQASDTLTALRGVVGEDGELRERRPFARSTPSRF